MSEWQDISTAPMDAAVWIYCDNGMRFIAVLESKWNWKRLKYIGAWEVQWPIVEVDSNATHWQPLPEPPVQP